MQQVKKVRIGKDIRVRWRITINGAPADLSLMDLKVEIRDRFFRKYSLSHVVEGSEIVTTWEGRMQQHTGVHTLTLWVNWGKSGQAVVDRCKFVELVPLSCMESDLAIEGATIEQISLSDNITLGVQGKSAFESWLEHGNVGSESDFIAWIQKPAHDAQKESAEQNRMLTEQEEGRKIAEHARVSEEQKRNMAEQARNIEEGKRNASESMRVEAEKVRATNFDKLSKDLQNATQVAGQAAASVDASKQQAIVAAQNANEQADRAKTESERMVAFTTSINVSNAYPTGSPTQSNIYTLQSAIAVVEERYRTVGLKCSFLTSASEGEEWQYIGGVYNDVKNWVRTDAKSLDNRRQEIDAARNEALSRINQQKVTPDMLSQESLNLINASGGGTINNQADGTDLQNKLVNGVQVMQFADRVHEPTKFNGKGRIYLRQNIVQGKNVLTQAMMQQENTVYVIRDDFDLDGKTLKIPSKCAIEFTGGTLSNGTLSLMKDTRIENSDGGCIFYGIKFIGDVYSVTPNVAWFVDAQYEVNGVLNDVTIDSSVELNKAFACGLKHFIFPSNKYYYLKNPIVINGDINIYAEKTEYQIRGHNSDRSYQGFQPCVYSNEIITLLEYNYSSNEERGINISGINFFIRVPYDRITDISKETPVAIIKNMCNMTLWGVIFDSNINVSAKQAIAHEGLPQNTQMCNYSGVKLVSEVGNITYVRLNGHMGYVFHQLLCDTKTNWITDIQLNGDAFAVSGYKRTGGNYKPHPIILNGSVQAAPYWTVDEYKNHAYFEECDEVLIYGKIWDLGCAFNDTYYSADRPFFVQDKGRGQFMDTNTYNDVLYNAQDGIFLDNDLFGSYNSLFMFDNLLTSFFNFRNNYPLISDFTYKIGGIDILSNYDDSNLKVYNIHKLLELSRLDNSNLNRNSCYFTNNVNSPIEIAFTITSNYVHISDSGQVIPMIIKSNVDYEWSVSVEYYKKDISVGKRVYHFKGNYYTRQGRVINLTPRQLGEAGKYDVIKVTIQSTKNPKFGIETNTPLVFIPTIKQDAIRGYWDMPNNIREGGFIPSFSRRSERPAWWTGNKWVNAQGRPFENSTMSNSTKPSGNDVVIGDCIYNTETHQPEWWDGSHWQTYDIRADIKRYGNVATRPLINNLDYRFAFVYFNTETNKPDFKIGNDWREYDGAKVGIKRYGPTSERPTDIVHTDGLVGFVYFDTDLKKPIWYIDNKQWADATGAVV